MTEQNNNYDHPNTPNTSQQPMEFLQGKDIGGFDQVDIEQNKVMAGLAYFIFFLPLIACPNSKFARFHANQSLVLALTAIALYIVTAILSAVLFAISWRLVMLSSLIYTVVSIGIAVIGIIGLINGFSGKAKELPVIGKIRIIK